MPGREGGITIIIEMKGEKGNNTAEGGDKPDLLVGIVIGWLHVNAFLL